MFFVRTDLLRTGAVGTFVLVVVGGAMYSIGGLVYGLKRPNPAPRWFGFHEVFHSFTIIGYIVHYVAVSMTAYRLPPLTARQLSSRSAWRSRWCRVTSMRPKCLRIEK